MEGEDWDNFDNDRLRAKVCSTDTDLWYTFIMHEGYWNNLISKHNKTMGSHFTLFFIPSRLPFFYP